MELWGMAQQELIENSTVNNLTFQVLQQTWINPMIQVDDQGKIIGHTIGKNQKGKPAHFDPLPRQFIQHQSKIVLRGFCTAEKTAILSAGLVVDHFSFWGSIVLCF